MAAPPELDLAPSDSPPAGVIARDGRRSWMTYLLGATLVAVLLLLVVYPLAVLLYAAFTDSPPRPGAPPGTFTLDNAIAITNPANATALGNSLIIGVGGTALAIVIGGGLAWLSARTDVPGRAIVQIAGIMPLFVAALIGALAWALLASPRTGYLNLFFREMGIPLQLNIFSRTGMVFVFGLYYAPYAFLLMNSALSLVNPEYEEAAEVHGGEMRRVLRGVTFPLVKPAVLGSVILTFALVLENFTIPQVLGSPVGIDTLPSRIYRLMTTSPLRPNEATFVGVLLMALLGGLIFLQNRMLRGRSYVTVTGKGFRPKLMPLGRWRWVAFGATMLYLLLAVGLPFFALFQGALRQHQFVPTLAALFDTSAMSLFAFEDVFTSSAFHRGLRNSLVLGAGTAVFGGLLHLILAYVSQRTHIAGRRYIEYLAVVPVAVPALVLSLGFLWAWINLPVPVFGTMAILVMAYAVRFMPQGYKGLTSTIGQVHPDLEESAFVAGASRARAVTWVTLPLIKTGVISTALLLFILAVRELTVALFLTTFNTRLLAILLFEEWQNGRWSHVSAISIFYSLLLLGITLIGRRWFRVQ